MRCPLDKCQCTALICRHFPQAIRSLVDKVRTDLDLDVFPFSVFHIFFEQYISIVSDAAWLLGAALLAVFAVVLVFTGSLWAAGA